MSNGETHATPPLTRERLCALLGPVATAGPLDAEVHDEVACDGYVRRLVSYNVPAGRASAFVCVPDGLTQPAPVVFCHHQHAGEFDLGKSEVCGLRGDPDQAYAAELAQRGFTSLPEASPDRVGFIGHSYGGRIAMWAPAWDERINVSVSNCGCIPYRDSFAHDAGFQAELVVPGFASSYDVDDLLALSKQSRVLLIAALDDVWSRGARDIEAHLRERGTTHVRVHVVPGDHEFHAPQRELAYEFLNSLGKR